MHREDPPGFELPPQKRRWHGDPERGSSLFPPTPSSCPLHLSHPPPSCFLNTQCLLWMCLLSELLEFCPNLIISARLSSNSPSSRKPSLMLLLALHLHGTLHIVLVTGQRLSKRLWNPGLAPCRLCKTETVFTISELQFPPVQAGADFVHTSTEYLQSIYYRQVLHDLWGHKRKQNLKHLLSRGVRKAVYNPQMCHVWHIAWKVVGAGLSDQSALEQRLQQILGGSGEEQSRLGEQQVQRPWGRMWLASSGASWRLLFPVEQQQTGRW